MALSTIYKTCTTTITTTTTVTTKTIRIVHGTTVPVLERQDNGNTVDEHTHSASRGSLGTTPRTLQLHEH